MAEKKTEKKGAEKKNAVVDKSPEGKQKALETALAQIEKQFGKGAVMKLGQATAMNVEVK